MGETSNNQESLQYDFCPAEQKAIEVHRYYLSEQYHRYISIEEAIRSWLRNYSQEWREEQMKKSSEAQLEEILKYKWIQSEKAGRDLGKTAVEDWIKKYSQIWRKLWEEKGQYP